ncbi:MAG TPA: condensation domain-containing protein, partial [Thermoanaerobaculia bacterium]|nr:condensation domain-containing protein [Thermoanaerobaculia bacterium]
VMLEVAEGAALDPARMARAVERLVEHHDQLRARFIRTGAGWRQEIAPPGGEAPFTLFDLSAVPDREAAMRVAADGVQAGFRLDRGPLLHAALFDLGSDRPERLLLAVHHLVIDAVSWPILLADLRAAYDGLPLPPKTTSFRRWAERLKEYAGTAEIRQELDFWRDGERTPQPLSIERDAERLEVRLGAEETRQLLSRKAEEVVLAAVAESLGADTIGIEGHGREPLFDDVDLSRTVGWFTSSFPLRLDPRGVKENLRRVPRRGIGYGVLRYLADAEPLRNQPRSEASFNYVGRVDDPGEGPLRLASDPGGAASDPRNPRPHPLAIDALVLGDELRMVWTYDRVRYRREEIERQAAETLNHLRALIARAPVPTAADFPHAGLEQAQLDRLLGKIGRQA